MLVRARMAHEVITVTPQTSVLNARRLMDAYAVRHLPVVDGPNLVGIVLWGRYRPVSAVMHRPVHVVHPEDTLGDAAQLLADTRTGALPVVKGGELVGILSVIDCLDALADLERASAADALSADELPLCTSAGAQEGQSEHPERKPAALVVHWDPLQRFALERHLQDEGYEVMTCPGPLSETWCPGARGAGDGPVCSRAPADVQLVVMDEGSSHTDLPRAYEAWLPGVPVRVLATDPGART